MKKMAKNVNLKEKKSVGDSVVYLVVAAFAVMLLLVMGLRRLGRFYSTLDGFGVLYPLMLTLAIVFAALAVAALIVRLVVKQPTVRTVCAYVLVLALLFAAICMILRVFWTDRMPLIYFLTAFVFCLYIVKQLYQWEFFLFSFGNVLAGFLFYNLSRGFGANFRTGFYVGFTVVCLAAITLLVTAAAKGQGMLRIGKKAVRLFPKSFNPTVFYADFAVCTLLIVLALLIGPRFATYCLLATIVFQLIAAVYYTFQLK